MPRRSYFKSLQPEAYELLPFPLPNELLNSGGELAEALLFSGDWVDIAGSEVLPKLENVEFPPFVGRFMEPLAWRATHESPDSHSFQWCPPEGCASCGGGDAGVDADALDGAADVGENGDSDASLSCPFGDGYYCGDVTLGQDSGSLYHCTQGQYSVSSDCGGAGCQVNTGAVDDICNLTEGGSDAELEAGVDAGVDGSLDADAASDGGGGSGGSGDIQAVGTGSPNGSSSGASLSYDGRYMAFSSDASNLVFGDTNGTSDAFVWDRQEGTTSRVSLGSLGQQASGGGLAASICGDGSRVAFL